MKSWVTKWAVSALGAALGGLVWAGARQGSQSTYVGYELPRCTAGQTVLYDANGRPGCGSAGGASLPSGAVVLVTGTACPSGLVEDDTFAGRFPQGTTAAAGDVGTTGGSTSYTPAGTVSQPTLTMNPYTPAGTVSQPTLTMNPYTPAGTLSTTTITVTGTKMSTAANGTPAATALAGTTLANGANTITLPAPTFTGQPATLTGTVSQPTFTGTQATLTGTVSQPTFTGAAATIVPPYKKVLFCRVP